MDPGKLLKGGLGQTAVSIGGHVQNGLECGGHTVRYHCHQVRRDQRRHVLLSDSGRSAGASSPMSSGFLTAVRFNARASGSWRRSGVKAAGWGEVLWLQEEAGRGAAWGSRPSSGGKKWRGFGLPTCPSVFCEVGLVICRE